MNKWVWNIAISEYVSIQTCPYSLVCSSLHQKKVFEFANIPVFANMRLTCH